MKNTRLPRHLLSHLTPPPNPPSIQTTPLLFSWPSYSHLPTTFRQTPQITVVAGSDGAAVPPADDNNNNFAGGSPSGSGTTVGTLAPTPTPATSSGTNTGSGHGGAANVGSVPGSKDTDEPKDSAVRNGVSVAFVVCAAVLAMAF